MKLIVFTKHFMKRPLSRLVEDLIHVGAEGADMAIRDGYHVEPANVEKKLPKVKKVFKEAGLHIPMATSPGAFTDPADTVAEKLVASLAASDIRLLKIGYWVVRDGYYALLDKARRELEGWCRLSEKYGVKILLHTHSGPYLASNAASMMDLLEGVNPAHAGAYLDTAHISVSGEPLSMAFEILKEYLAVIAVKDFAAKRTLVDGKKGWKRRIVPVGEGFGEWNILGGLMAKYNFDGPVSFHSEYTGYGIRKIINQTKRDIEFFRTEVLHK